MDSIPWGQDVPVVLGPSLQAAEPHHSSFITFRTDFMPASVKQARTGVFLIPEQDDKDYTLVPQVSGAQACHYKTKLETLPEAADPRECVAYFDGSSWHLETAWAKGFARRKEGHPDHIPGDTVLDMLEAAEEEVITANERTGEPHPWPTQQQQQQASQQQQLSQLNPSDAIEELFDGGSDGERSPERPMGHQQKPAAPLAARSPDAALAAPPQQPQPAVRHAPSPSPSPVQAQWQQQQQQRQGGVRHPQQQTSASSGSAGPTTTLTSGGGTVLTGGASGGGHSAPQAQQRQAAAPPAVRAAAAAAAAADSDEEQASEDDDEIWNIVVPPRATPPVQAAAGGRSQTPTPPAVAGALPAARPAAAGGPIAAPGGVSPAPVLVRSPGPQQQQAAAAAGPRPPSRVRVVAEEEDEEEAGGHGSGSESDGAGPEVF